MRVTLREVPEIAGADIVDEVATLRVDRGHTTSAVEDLRKTSAGGAMHRDARRTNAHSLVVCHYRDGQPDSGVAVWLILHEVHGMPMVSARS